MALPVTTSLVEDSAARLAAGGWQLHARQLYYATCARAETTPCNAASNGEIGLGVLMILIGLILIGIKVLFALFVTLGVALILTGVLGRHPPSEVDGAAARALIRRIPYSLRIARPGRLDPSGRRPGCAGIRGRGSTTIVTDTPDTAALIAANAERAELGAVDVVVANDGPTPDRGTRVIVLHDASPRGCALVLDLRDAGVEVVDGGLRPRDVDVPSHQVIEGAPARLPRDLSTLLDVTSSTGSSAAGESSSRRSHRRSRWIGFAPRSARLDPLRGDAPQPAR